MISKLNSLVDSYKENIISDTQKLISFNSVCNESDKKDQPFGEQIASALECVLTIAEEMGFSTRNVDGYMGEIDWGSSGKKIGVIAHIDIVPAGEGWTYPPFAGQVVDGKLYGRGAIDDKGPLVAVLYAMKAIKESGLPSSNSIRFLIGCDEESGFRCIKHYLTHENQPWGGFSPDGEFPVIFGEKGIFRFECKKAWGDQKKDNNQFTIVNISGGTRLNVVPEQASAVLKGNKKLFDLAKQAIDKYNPEKRLSLKQKGDQLIVAAQGASTHSSMPWQGVNANNILVNYLCKLPLGPKVADQYIKSLADYFTDGYYGESLGIAANNEVFGKLTLSLGLLKADSFGGTASFDLRYPDLDKRNSIWGKISAVCEEQSFELNQLQDKPGLYVPQESDLIQSLLKAYQETSGRHENPITIGGGTYCRSLDNFVAFGPLFPGQKELAHERDEYIDVDDLLLCSKIYAQALYSLTM